MAEQREYRIIEMVTHSALDEPVTIILFDDDIVIDREPGYGPWPPTLRVLRRLHNISAEKL